MWTKDKLPYPGLAPKRSEYNIRGTANSVMRKLSMASIASNFSRRSGGHSSNSILTGMPAEGKLSKPRPKPKPSSSGYGSDGTTTVNFHTAPEAFLPLDFELPDRGKRAKTMTALRTLTMSSERPRSPFAASPMGESSVAEVKRSRSVFGHFSSAAQHGQIVTSTKGTKVEASEPCRRRQSTVAPRAEHATRAPEAGVADQSRADTRLTTRRARAMTKLTKLWN